MKGLSCSLLSSGLKKCLLILKSVRVTQRTSNTASYRPTPNRGSSSSGSSRSIISAATLKHHGRTKVQSINIYLMFRMMFFTQHRAWHCILLILFINTEIYIWYIQSFIRTNASYWGSEHNLLYLFTECVHITYLFTYKVHHFLTKSAQNSGSLYNRVFSCNKI